MKRSYTFVRRIHCLSLVARIFLSFYSLKYNVVLSVFMKLLNEYELLIDYLKYCNFINDELCNKSESSCIQCNWV
jgi:hypothetical protein